MLYYKTVSELWLPIIIFIQRKMINAICAMEPFIYLFILCVCVCVHGVWVKCQQMMKTERTTHTYTHKRTHSRTNFLNMYLRFSTQLSAISFMFLIARCLWAFHLWTRMPTILYIYFLALIIAPAILHRYAPILLLWSSV